MSFPNYNTQPEPTDQLGEATLTLDGEDWDASNMSFKDMWNRYEPEIRTAKKAVLSSSLLGDYFFNRDLGHWKRVGYEHRV